MAYTGMVQDSTGVLHQQPSLHLALEDYVQYPPSPDAVASGNDVYKKSKENDLSLKYEC